MSQTTDLIKRLRKAGLSQTEIARRTGIPQPRLSRWEAGEAPTTADDALKLAALVESTAAPPLPADAGGDEPSPTPLSMGVDAREHSDAAQPVAVERRRNGPNARDEGECHAA